MDPCDTGDLDCKEFVKTRRIVRRKTIRRNGKTIRIKKIIKQKVIVKCCTKPISFCQPRPNFSPLCPPFIPPRDGISLFQRKE